MTPDVLWEWPIVPAATLVFGGVTIVVIAIDPLRVERRNTTRRPTGTELDRLVNPVSGSRRVRPRITDPSADESAPRARALGILPGYRYVFVAEQLLNALSTQAARAVIAHEIGHHRGWHPLVRIVLPIAGLIGWAIAIANDIPYPLISGLGVLLPYTLLVCFLQRRTEYWADEYAAEQVSYVSMIGALRHLKRTSSDQHPTGLAGFFATQPSFDDRIEHLVHFVGTNDDGGEAPPPWTRCIRMVTRHEHGNLERRAHP